MLFEGRRQANEGGGEAIDASVYHAAISAAASGASTTGMELTRSLLAQMGEVTLTLTLTLTLSLTLTLTLTLTGRAPTLRAFPRRALRPQASAHRVDARGSGGGPGPGRRPG